MIRAIVLASAIGLGLTASAAAQDNTVQISFLPSARAGAPDEVITIFGTLVNASEEALDCAPQTSGLYPLPDGVRGRFWMSAMDNGVVTGGRNASVNIPAGESQDYLIEMTVDAEFYGRVRTPRIRCVGDSVVANTRQYRFVNDILLSISAGAQPDIVMIGDTLSRDGVARVGSTGPRAALLTVAAVNIGDPSADLEVFPAFAGFPGLNSAADLQICEVDADGLCLEPEGDSVLIDNWASDEIRLFAVRARFPGAIGVPFYPDVIRLFAAVREAPAAPAPAAGPDAPSGRFDLEIDEFAATSAGVRINLSEIRVRDPRDAATPTPVQVFSCALRHDYDTGGEIVGMENARIVMQPNGSGGAVLGGWAEDFDGRHLVSLDLPSWDDAIAAGRLHSAGDSSPFSSDLEMTFNIRFDAPSGGMQIEWEGGQATEFATYFNDAGRMRCASLPAPAGQPDFAGDHSQLVSGEWFGFDVSGFGNELGEAAVSESLPAGTRDAIALFDEVVRGRAAPTDPQNDLQNWNLWDDLYAWFGATADGAAQARPNGPFLTSSGLAGLVFPGRYRDDNGVTRADCFVLSLFDSGEDTADADARLWLFLREGSETESAIEDCVEG